MTMNGFQGGLTAEAKAAMLANLQLERKYSSY